MAIFGRRKQPEERADVGIGPYEGDGMLSGRSIPFGERTGKELPMEMQAAMIRPVIGKDQVREAMHTLRRYKAGKAHLEQRIIENEEWWKQRHWQYFKEKGTTTLETKSAWLVNVILSKHADAMDAMPEPNCLPRAADDEEEANILSKVVPVILQRNDFEKAWSDNWWKKLKAGVAIYGVYWDPDALNGLGDVTVRTVDPLEIYWEPGVRDIQDSRNVFLIKLMDNDLIEESWPELKGKLGTKAITAREYRYDDSVDTSDKSPVIDWYYKKKQGDRTVLHYVKFVGEYVLYATENEAGSAGGMNGAGADEGMALTERRYGDEAGMEYQAPGAESLSERGLYDHGMYPFFLDVLFPEEGTPAGFGYVDVCKDPQRQIDLMNNAIVANCIAGATPRWMVRGEGGVNEAEYADWTRPFVHVQGSLDEAAIKQIVVNPLAGNYLNILQMKIEEMKETSGNRDVNNGGAPSGVTAASAIAAMQEQSGKLSRDQIQSSYNCYRQIVYCVIEMIRQFYDLPRKFRIVGEQGETAYVTFDNKGLMDRNMGYDPLIQRDNVWRPVFDIEVNAQKQSAYNKLSYNELAIQFYQLGFFNPQMADPALAALEMMEFKGKEQVRQRIQQNGGMMEMIQMLQAQVQALQAQLGIAPAQEEAQTPAGPGGSAEPVKLAETDSLGDQKNQNGIVERAKANANNATQPR